MVLFCFFVLIYFYFHQLQSYSYKALYHNGDDEQSRIISLEKERYTQKCVRFERRFNRRCRLGNHNWLGAPQLGGPNRKGPVTVPSCYL